jgi:hypothetical protein
VSRYSGFEVLASQDRYTILMDLYSYFNLHLIGCIKYYNSINSYSYHYL